jgi:hypothetical protein
MIRKSAARIVSRTRILLAFAVCAASFCLAPPRASAAGEASPCPANSAVRQLDYWLGDWVIGTNEGPGNSTSKVYLSLDKCIVIESWDGGAGHIGENIFAYSLDDRSWRGMFVDNRGHAHVFVDGKVADGSAEFDGPSRGPHGEAVLNRIKIVRVDANQVTQTWEKSTDNGATWTTVFRGVYTRKTKKP